MSRAGTTAELHLSATAVKSYRECPRRWYFAKVERLPEPPNPSFALGTAVHAALESYLRGEGLKGTPLAVQIAMPGLRHLPPPGAPGLLVEVPLEQPALALGGLPFVGYADLVAPCGAPHGGPWVYDHKTSSDPGRYAKTTEQLEVDPQMVAYARWAFARWPDTELVRVSHVYYATKGTPRSARVDADVTRAIVYTVWDALEPDALAMSAAMRERPGPAALPTRAEACFSFGKPCPFTAACRAAQPPGTSPRGRFTLGTNTEQEGRTTMPKPTTKPTLTPAVPAVPLEPSPELPAREPLRLFVDCVPEGLFCEPLETHLAPLCAAVCETEGVADVRLVSYGRGPGLVAALLRARPPVGNLIAHSGTTVSSAAVEALAPLASLVVRGLR